MTHPETERYYTPKLSLTAPSIDDEISACRDNWDRLDEAYSGGIIVNPGVMPDESVLYDGCIVAERSTGIIWRAQRNVSGVFEKRYIKYPWRMDAYQGIKNVASVGPGSWIPWGWETVGDLSFNASASDIVDFRIVIPITGIYIGTDWIKWHAGGNAGARAASLMVNDQFPGGQHDSDYYEHLAVPNNVVNEVTTNEVNFCRKFYKGDRIVGAVWHNSGNIATNDHSMHMQLIRALDT